MPHSNITWRGLNSFLTSRVPLTITNSRWVLVVELALTERRFLWILLSLNKLWMEIIVTDWNLKDLVLNHPFLNWMRNQIWRDQIINQIIKLTARNLIEIQKCSQLLSPTLQTLTPILKLSYQIVIMHTTLLCILPNQMAEMKLTY